MHVVWGQVMKGKGWKDCYVFNIKTMIDLPKILSSYVTRKGINEYNNGNTWVVGGQ